MQLGSTVLVNTDKWHIHETHESVSMQLATTGTMILTCLFQCFQCLDFMAIQSNDIVMRFFVDRTTLALC